MSDYPEMCPVCHKADADLCFCSKAAQDAAWNRRAQPAAPAVSWRDHVEQRLHSWRSTTMNADGDCISLSDCLNLEAMDNLIDFVCDESVGPASPADAAPSVAPEPREQQTQKSINLLRSALLRIEHAQSIHTAHALAESALRKWRSQNGEGHENCDV